MRRIAALTMLCFLMCMCPLVSYATWYGSEEYGINIALDDNEWFVLTKDDHDVDPDEYGLTSEEIDSINSVFKDGTIYLDAIRLEDGTELIVQAQKTHVKTSLSEMSNDQIDDYIAQLQNENGCKNCEVYTMGSNDYVLSDFYHEESEYYIYSFSTITNGREYCLFFQNRESFWRSDKDEFDEIICNVTYFAPSESGASDFGVSLGAIAAGVLVGILCLIGIIVAVKKKNKAKRETDIAPDKELELQNAQETPGDKVEADSEQHDEPDKTEDDSEQIPTDDLRQLKVLHEEGILTDEEYEAKKKQLLNI